MPELIRDVDVLPPNLKSTANSNLPFLVLKKTTTTEIWRTKCSGLSPQLCDSPRDKNKQKRTKKKTKQQIQNVRDPIRLVLMLLFTSSPLFSDMCENKGRLRRLSFSFASQSARL